MMKVKQGMSMDVSLSPAVEGGASLPTAPKRKGLGAWTPVIRCAATWDFATCRPLNRKYDYSLRKHLSNARPATGSRSSRPQ